MQERTIIILGKTGHGKSTLANGLFGLTGMARQFREGETGYKRLTMDSQVYRGTVENVCLEVIDTPGLFEQDINVGKRWQSILRAFLLGSQRIDAVIIVVDSKELHSGARCVSQIMDTIGPTIFCRTIICFSKYSAPVGGRKQTKQDIMRLFNQHLSRAVIGAHWVFYDKNDPQSARKESVREILDHVEKIQEIHPTEITKDTFKSYTKRFFTDVIQSIPREITLAQLQNESFIDMNLMKIFLTTSEMGTIVEAHNSTIPPCTIL